MSRTPTDPSADLAAPAPPAFAPRSWFYGWFMLPVATLGVICTSPGQSFVITIFRPFIQDELGITKTQATGAYAFGTGFAALMMTFVGMAMDRFGLRKTLAAVVLLLAAACTLMANVQGLASLFFAFLFLRMFGQGALGMLSGNVLAMWFHRKLGATMGIMATGMAAAIAFVPGLSAVLVEQLGWRGAYLALGTLVLAIMGPLLLWVHRNRPEDVGQRVDGDDEPHPDDQPPPTERAFTMKQALATRSFWLALSAFVFFGFSVTAMIICATSIFESRGFSPEESAALAARITFALGMTLVAGQFVAGLLADRLPLHVMLAGSPLMLALAAWILRHPDSAEWVLVLGFVIGIAQALTMAVGGTIWVRYYGRTHLGKIRGVVTTFGAGLSGFGPFMVDGMAELFHGYNGVLLGLVIAPIPLALAVLFATRPPEPPSQPQ